VLMTGYNFVMNGGMRSLVSELHDIHRNSPKIRPQCGSLLVWPLLTTLT